MEQKVRSKVRFKVRSEVKSQVFDLKLLEAMVREETIDK